MRSKEGAIGSSDAFAQGDPGELIHASVVFALPERQWNVAVVLRRGETVGQAIERSGLDQSVPELQGRKLAVGIFQHRCTLETQVREGDRIEIYRPLLIDPKEARRLRVRNKKLPPGTRG